MTIQPDLIASIYLDAKEYVIQKGYAGELDWQAQRSFHDVSESQFLGEAAWVILSSGFREAIVRKLFPSISAAFLTWESASAIEPNIKLCKEGALRYFRNERKIDAICSLISVVSNNGFEQVKKNVVYHGLDYLQSFSFIGPITGRHLLKNLGIPISKPDRHLARIAETIGFRSVQELCETIELVVGDSIAEIDLVLWRYATLKPNYLTDFRF